MPKYPNIKVKLTGRDGNAFAIMGLVQQAMKKAKLADTEIDKWRKEVTAGDYDHLLQTCMKWVEVS